MNRSKSLNKAWMGVLLAGVLVGLYAAVMLFTRGHYLFNANDTLLWTLPLGAYVFFALTSTGLSLVASIPLVFGVKSYEPIAKRLVFLAIATLSAAFISIGLELGSIPHMIYILLSPNLSSPIWYMGALYSLELVLLIIKLWSMHTSGRVSGGKGLAVASMLCGTFAALMLGAVFGLTEARPTYFGPFISVFCLAVALLSGMAAIMLYEVVLGLLAGGITRHKGEILELLSRKFSFVVGLVLLFYVLKLALESAYTLPEFATDIHFGLVLVLVVPYALMLSPSLRKTVWAQVVASTLTLAGIFAVHMQILLGGQVRPMGPKGEGLPEVLSYTPSIWEYMVLICAVSVMLLLYTLGERYLNLEQGSS